MASTAKQVFSRVYKAPVFSQTIVLSDGSTFTKLSTSPRPSIRLTKDIRNAQLYNPDAGKSLNQEENGRLAQFKGRFAGYEQDADAQDDDMDWMVSDSARAAPKLSDREMRESKKKKPSKGKN